MPSLEQGGEFIRSLRVDARPAGNTFDQTETAPSQELSLSQLYEQYIPSHDFYAVGENDDTAAVGESVIDEDILAMIDMSG